MKLQLYILFFLFLAGACAKDDGNYAYLTVNDISIDSIKGEYSVIQYDTLMIKPFLKFKETELKKLSFEWKVNGEIVSVDPICHAQIKANPNIESDPNKRSYDALLTITNDENDLKYYKYFKVKVGTAYSNALYILSEQAGYQAMLSFQRRDKANMPLEHHVFETANPRLGSLGLKPRQVYTGSIMGKTFIVLCEEGERKMVKLKTNTLEQDRSYGAETVLGNYSGTFTPYNIKVCMGGMVVAKEGLFGYNYMNSNAIYRPIAGDYDFARWVDCNYTMDAYLWISYDNKSEQFMKLEITKGIAYDKVTPITNSAISTQGQKFLAGGHSGYETSRPVLYNASEKKAYFYKLEMTADEWDMVTFEPIWVINYNKIMERTNLMDENSVNIFGEKSLYWFIANGNKIVRLHGDGGEIKDVFTAPAGNVTTMMLDEKEERLFIATSDGNKSWIYAVGVLSENFGIQKETPLEMDGKIVSIAATGKWAY